MGITITAEGKKPVTRIDPPFLATQSGHQVHGTIFLVTPYEPAGEGDKVTAVVIARPNPKLGLPLGHQEVFERRTLSVYHGTVTMRTESIQPEEGE